jgi:hypothetical protein
MLLVDMASGRYLYRAWKEHSKQAKEDDDARPQPPSPSPPRGTARRRTTSVKR